MLVLVLAELVEHYLALQLIVLEVRCQAIEVSRHFDFQMSFIDQDFVEFEAFCAVDEVAGPTGARMIEFDRVTISYDEPEVRIRVTDDGIPAVPNTQGHGIEGMRERVALHHGVLRAGPADDRGWLVEATLRPNAVPV